MNIRVIQVDYFNAQHAAHLVALLDAYARDPMGGGKALEPEVKTKLVPALAKLPNAFSLIAYIEDQPVGLANCFQSFSTFACKPLINIHDIMVVKEQRGKGISQLMLDRVESIAREKNCCKITLEVLSNNHAALSAYRQFGFEAYQLDPASGKAEFWQKPLH